VACEQCGSESPALIELNPEVGTLKKCANCGATEVMNRLIPMSPDVPQQSPPSAEPAAPKPAEPNAVPAKAKPPRVKRVAPKPGDAVRRARAELKQVRRDLKQARKELAQLEKAEQELSRLVDAADGKSLAVVRQLQSRRN
jgi:hypothetical protein